jgi:hypothetical protein
MLLHIRPRLFYPSREVTLVDVTIDALGLHLQGGSDLSVGRPYPNKHYTVAYRRMGRKALDGFLIETTPPVQEWRCTARWAVEAEVLVTHHVDYQLNDQDFEAASDNMMFWYACCEGLGGWASRMLPEVEGVGHIYVEPTMEVIPGNPKKTPTQDRLDHRGRIVERHQKFRLPTIERDRLLSTNLVNRMPGPETPFRALPGRSCLDLPRAQSVRL